MTDTSLTFIHNDDGPLDVRRVERILQLEAENAALREALTALLRDVEHRSTWSDAGKVASVDRARALIEKDQQP